MESTPGRKTVIDLLQDGILVSNIGLLRDFQA